MTPYFSNKIYHKLLPLIRYLPLRLQVKIASIGREYFMQKFVQTKKQIPYVPDAKFALKMWGIEFRAPISNASGMFKNGDGYDTVASFGAGAYIGGTSTNNRRFGNKKHGIRVPFMTLPRSHITINWLGLPNFGDEILGHKILTRNKVQGCPVGWSIMRSPDYHENKGMDKLIESLWLYHANSQIDFLEINESCPNIQLSGASIISRLQRISREFLLKRRRRIPVVVKLSHNLSESSLEELVVALINLKYDGINIGNSSSAYSNIRNKLDPLDHTMFDYFTAEFGGGVGGCILKEQTLNLCSKAVEIVKRLNPIQEFHVIRTGGVDSYEDLEASAKAGISFNHWYTGFFENYNQFGDKTYQQMFHGKNSIV